MHRIVQGYTVEGNIITIDTQAKQYSWVGKDSGHTTEGLEKHLLEFGCMPFEAGFDEVGLRKLIVDYVKGGVCRSKYLASLKNLLLSSLHSKE